MSSSNISPYPCDRERHSQDAPPPSLDVVYDGLEDESDDEVLIYPDDPLPERFEPYNLRTRVDKDAIDGIEKTTATIKGIISRGLFPDDVFPVDPSEFTHGLDDISYSVSDAHWLLDYPPLDLSPEDRARAMAHFLNQFVQLAWQAHNSLHEPVPVTPRQWIVTKTPRVLINGEIEQCYGLALVDADIEPQWRDVLCDVQMAPTEDLIAGAVHRISTGSANIFASQEDRLFHVGLAVAGDNFQLVYQDRAGRVLSEVLDIHADAILFARIILGLALLPKSLGGKDESIVSRDGRRFVTVGDVEYEICETLSISRKLCGSGTICWRCRRHGCSEDFIVKHVWADMELSHSEGDLLKRISHLEGVPDLICEEKVLRDDGSPCTTMWCMMLHPMKRFGDRVAVPQLELRRLVLQPCARPLADFASKEEFLGAFRDAVEVHQVLYDIYDLLHCDISDNNIMLRGQGSSSQRRGLLIDFDCAVLVTDREDEKTAYMGYRAGTLPFMSYELLRYRRVRHGPWHDLESFLYVLIFVCATCAGPRGTRRKAFELSQSPLAPWLAGNGEKKEEVMRTYDDDAFRAFLDSVFDPYFDDLKDLVCELRTAILRRDKTKVCHDDVLDIIDRCIESRRGATDAYPGTHQQSLPLASGGQGSPKRKRLSLDDTPSSHETMLNEVHPHTPPRSPQIYALQSSRGGTERTLVEVAGVPLEKGTSEAMHSPKRLKSM